MAKIYVDDVPVSVKELYEVLGIDHTSIPKKLQRIFEINPDRVRKDEHGNEKTPRRMGVSTKFQTFSKLRGQNVQVRYAEEAKRDNKNGYILTKYYPAQLWINGKEESISDDLQYAFMYVHPDCFQSPTRIVGGTFRYLFKDNEAIAMAELLRDEQEMRAMSMIIGSNALPLSQIKQIAKGMNISGVDLLTEGEIRTRLKKLAKENPNKFFDDATSNSVQFNGLLQDAVDKSIVKVISNNGFKRWYFYNEELCVINTGTNEMNALKEAVVQRMELIPQLQTALEGRTIESELEKPENQAYFNAFKVTGEVTKNDVSTNIEKENKEIQEQLTFEADIKLLAEQEDTELSGGKAMHFQRKLKLERFRAEVDAYKASLTPVE